MAKTNSQMFHIPNASHDFLEMCVRYKNGSAQREKAKVEINIQGKTLLQTLLLSKVFRLGKRVVPMCRSTGDLGKEYNLKQPQLQRRTEQTSSGNNMKFLSIFTFWLCLALIIPHVVAGLNVYVHRGPATNTRR